MIKIKIKRIAKILVEENEICVLNSSKY